MTDKDLENLNLEGIEGLTQLHLDQLSWAMLEKEEKQESRKNIGILSLWITATVSFVIGIWQTTWGSPSCVQVQCPYAEITHLSIGVGAFFVSTISLVVGLIVRFGWHQKSGTQSNNDGYVLTQALLDLEKEGVVKRNTEPPVSEPVTPTTNGQSTLENQKEQK